MKHSSLCLIDNKNILAQHHGCKAGDTFNICWWTSSAALPQCNYVEHYVMQCLMTKQASQRNERKRTHQKQALLFSIRCCNSFQQLKSSIFRTHKILYQVCLLFQSTANPFPNLSPIFFSNDSLPVSRVETNRRKRQFLSASISLWSTLQETFPNPLQRHHSKSCVWFFSCLSQSDTIADGSGPSVSDRLDPLTFLTLCRHYSVNAFVF